MTTRLASDDPRTLHAVTIGAPWLAVARQILADGIVGSYDDLPVRYVLDVLADHDYGRAR